jgi:hypothetical protein
LTLKIIGFNYNEAKRELYKQLKINDDGRFKDLPDNWSRLDEMDGARGKQVIVVDLDLNSGEFQKVEK